MTDFSYSFPCQSRRSPIMARNVVARFQPLAESLHLQIEAMKLTFTDVEHYIGDPQTMEIAPETLLDPDYLASRAKLINRSCAGTPEAGAPKDGGTLYITAADADNMMVSFIQSNYSGFGSGVVVPDTGISLQNRRRGHVITREEPEAALFRRCATDPSDRRRLYRRFRSPQGRCRCGILDRFHVYA